MGIGLKRGSVAVVPHQVEWETTARQTIKELKLILENIAVDIQHIGSTAIKNISAKPIIDIVIGVYDFKEILALNDKLSENGFIFRGQDMPEQYLYVCGESDFRTHHIHVVIYNSSAWNNYINMRDYLNCHAADAHAYSRLKESLAKRYPNDRQKHTAMKSDFINNILLKAQEAK